MDPSQSKGVIVRRILVTAVLIAGVAFTAVGGVFASARLLGNDGNSPSQTIEPPLGVVPRTGECIQIDYYNIGPRGRGPESPMAAVALISKDERGLKQRRVSERRVVLERFEDGKKAAAYEAHLFDGFSPRAWMVTRSARSRPCEAAMSGEDMRPEVPPINRPEEPPSN